MPNLLQRLEAAEAKVAAAAPRLNYAARLALEQSIETRLDDYAAAQAAYEAMSVPEKIASKRSELAELKTEPRGEGWGQELVPCMIRHLEAEILELEGAPEEEVLIALAEVHLMMRGRDHYSEDELLDAKKCAWIGKHYPRDYYQGLRKWAECFEPERKAAPKHQWADGSLHTEPEPEPDTVENWLHRMQHSGPTEAEQLAAVQFHFEHLNNNGLYE